MLLSHDIQALIGSDGEKTPYVVIKDDVFEDFIDDLFGEVQELRSRMRPARMSRGDSTWEDDLIRGDSLCWVTPQICNDLKLDTLDKYVKRMLAECEVMKEALGLIDEYNIQFAIYPGKGETYHRHRDAFPRSDTDEPSRQLTCLLYLNREWLHDDGGQLRIFTTEGIKLEGAGEPFSFWGVYGYDIEPIFGRLVVFRSDLVDHAVLPCHRERSALTLWIHGTGPEGGDSHQLRPETVFTFAPVAVIEPDTVNP